MWRLGIALLAGCAVEGLGSEEQDIINGSLATTTTYKSIAAMWFENSHGQQTWFCTGVLIDPSYILTQGSCFDAYGLDPSTDVDKLAVWFGLDDTGSGSGGTYAGVTQAWAQTSDNWGNDLAILKLASPIPDRATTIVRTRPTAGATATMVGYGATDNNGDNQGVLRKASWPTVGCAGADSSLTASDILCVSASTASACGDGDQGNALFDSGGQVVGVYQGRTQQQCSSGVDVFTSVADQLAFIDAHVPAAVPPPTTTPPPPGGTPDPTAPPTAPAPTVGGCNAGGGHGGLLVLALGLIARRARSKRS